MEGFRPLIDTSFRFRLFLAVLALAWFAGNAMSQAAPGDPDPTFGKGGVVTVDVPTDGRMTLLDFKRLPDGRMLLSGGGKGDGDGIVTRLLADGSVDENFGSDGFFKMPDSSWEQIVSAPDGKVVAFGRIGNDPSVIRLDADGQLDPTFSADGIVVSDLHNQLDSSFDDPYGPEIGFNAGNIDDQGRIVAASASRRCGDPDDISASDPGDESCRDLAIMRLLPDGTPDASLGDDGLIQVGSGYSYYDMVPEVAVQEDGSLIFANGEDATGDYASEPNSWFWVVRFNPDGTRRSQFGHDGRVLLPYSLTKVGSWFNVEGIHVLGDGSMVITAGPQIIRLTATGGLDDSLIASGARTLEGTDYKVNSNLDGEISRSVVSANGKRVYLGIVGGVYYGNGSKQRPIGVVRTTPNGFADPTFSTDGTASKIVDSRPPPVGGNWIEHAEASIPILLEGGRVRVAATTMRDGKVRFAIVQFQGGSVPRLKCNGKYATVQGSDASDVILAGKITATGNGDDKIHTSVDGQLCAGAGDDTLESRLGAGGRFFLGSGDDIVKGRVRGLLLGGPGKDVIFGGEALKAFGGPGDDVITGGNYPQRLHGGQGNDVLRGMGGDDLLYGDKGDDRLFGGKGTDSLFGGPGRDALAVGPMGRRFHRYRYKGRGLDMELFIYPDHKIEISLEYRIKCQRGGGYATGSGSLLGTTKVDQETGRFRFEDAYEVSDWYSWNERGKGRVTPEAIYLLYSHYSVDRGDYFDPQICHTGTDKNSAIWIKAVRTPDPRQIARQ